MKIIKPLITILILLLGSSMFAVESEYCERAVSHFNLNSDGSQSSAVYLTISNIDATSFYVEMVSVNQADSLDYFEVQGVPSSTSSLEISEEGAYKKTYTLNEAAPDSLELNFLWSKLSSGGNWMLVDGGKIKVAFLATCTPAVEDTEAPSNFTAQTGTVTHNSVELLLSAEDNSGTVEYIISYGSTEETTSGNSGDQVVYEVSGLDAETAYTFNVEAKDASDNIAANNPIVLNETTNSAPSSEYCERLVSHFNINSDGSQSSAVSLTISNIDETSFYIEMISVNQADSLDYFEVQGTPSSTSSLEISEEGAYKKTYTLNGEAPDSLELNFLWSKISTGGNWMLVDGGKIKVIFSGSCDTDPGVPTLTKATASVKEVSLYPNPVSDQLYISSEATAVQLSIYSLSGQLVKTVVPQGASVSVSELKSGLYMTKIRFEDGTSSFEQIIKQ